MPDIVDIMDAPPITTSDEGPPSITDRYPQYASTPMPTDTGSEDGEYEEQATTSYGSSFLKNATLICVLALLISHLHSMWTLSTDVNILLAYQKENVEQYKHIAHLLQNMHQVKWQMVPST